MKFCAIIQVIAIELVLLVAYHNKNQRTLVHYNMISVLIYL